MSRRYRVLLPLSVQPREGGAYEQHEEFETTFTEDEETENVRSGSTRDRARHVPRDRGQCRPRDGAG
jgi:hypothetical protein